MDANRDDAERDVSWNVEANETTEGLAADLSSGPSAPDGGGRIVYRDEDGRRFRLPADLGELTKSERDAALQALSDAIGALPRHDARTFAVDHLKQMRAAGRMTEEAFEKECRRILDY